MTAPEQSRGTQESETFTRAVLGEGAGRLWPGRLAHFSPELKMVLVVALLGTVIFIPYLGAVGLWDPWETHYGEVARSMIERNDYVYPYWEHAWFFSKTPMTMWLQALGMNAVGAMDVPAGMSRYTEWGMRLPFALLSIAALVLVAVALGRLVSRRAGLAAAFALATMPTWFLLTRQTVTDTPFVASLTMAMACAMIGQLDARTRHRAGWWYAFWILCGVSALSKGIMGLALPALFLGTWFLLVEMPWDREGLLDHLRYPFQREARLAVREGRRELPALWAQFSKMRLLPGLGVFLLVVGPWFLTLHLFEGVDESSKRFWYRFWIHDHINRLAAGVHTTTPDAGFTYFIEQGAFGMFPWVALLPGVFAVTTRLKLRGGSVADKVWILGLVWSVGFFLLISLSATKFHHYIFPALPGMAILIGLYVDRLWKDGLSGHVIPLLLGLVLFILVGKDLAESPKHLVDLFVYNYERAYPWDLVNGPVGTLGGSPLRVGHVLVLIAGVVGVLLLSEGLFSRGAKRTLGIGGAILAVAAVLGLVMVFGEGTRGLFENFTVRSGLSVTFGLAGGLFVLGLLWRSRTALFFTFWGLAAGFAIWVSWSHWVDMSHHWTQRDLFWRYYEQRQEGEPIAAYLMNWRGETFYSRNTVRQIPSKGASRRVRAYAAQPGREWALVEHHRLDLLRKALGSRYEVTPVDRDVNNKFVLVTID